MGIEQIRMNQTKALPPASQFNWSQMESSLAKTGSTRWMLEGRSPGHLEIPLSDNGISRFEPEPQRRFQFRLPRPFNWLTSSPGRLFA